ncbi:MULTISPECIES: nucleoside triphosphate pyrophosphatase [unclassified Carboxydocella]|uniref:Maf family protein n=1 Tax=unclassified Carboxydocella TaxID=2685367 RepID=UPI0009AE2555|nr:MULTISPECIES: Maf family protein [unclassified Carboxydocella]GAW27788.1 septum formation inhibitor Maf [Carboxydocella sp. ULO1]GAW30298.1 septum formation inhibitor Maf [Carboxydocella sp. JDF658]
MKLVLASASPRRQQLLKLLGLDFQVLTADIDETLDSTQPLASAIQDLARRKAQAVQEQLPERPADLYILAADTVVVLEGQVLGKPASAREAEVMLQFLSGRTHQVMTGVVLLRADGDCCYSDYAVTEVAFRPLTAAEIRAYVATGEPLDKAGAYGIQGLGSLLVDRINGCYYNVVGLPLVKTMQLLRQAGWRILS